ncbi:MAG: O-antigen ligase family protein [Elusimicrobia bacterium]|nr:O-antigen ligase family protein [Elusimicrobiota bacterium]
MVTYAMLTGARLLAAVLLVTLLLEDADGDAALGFLTAAAWACSPLWATVFHGYLSGSFRVDLRVESWLHPSQASAIGISSGLMLLARGILVQRRAALHFAGAGFALGAGFLAGGKSAIVGLAFCSITAPFLLRGNLVRLRTLLLLPLLLAAVLAAALRSQGGLFAHLAFYSAIQVKTGTTLFTMVDRVLMWHAAVLRWWDSPFTVLFGHGLASTRISGITQSYGIWTTSHVHNSFLQTLVDGGVTGLLLLLPALLAARNAPRAFADPRLRAAALVASAGFLPLLLAAAVENIFGSAPQPTTFLFLAALGAIIRLGEVVRAPSSGAAAE